MGDPPDRPAAMGGHVRSIDISLPVTAGIRWISFLPLPDGSYVLVDSTGGGANGLILLGQLTLVAPDSFLATDAQGQTVGTGNLWSMARALFDRHPERLGLLDRGVAPGAT